MELKEFFYRGDAETRRGEGQVFMFQYLKGRYDYCDKTA